MKIVKFVTTSLFVFLLLNVLGCSNGNGKQNDEAEMISFQEKMGVIFQEEENTDPFDLSDVIVPTEEENQEQSYAKYFDSVEQ